MPASPILDPRALVRPAPGAALCAALSILASGFDTLTDAVGPDRISRTIALDPSTPTEQVSWSIADASIASQSVDSISGRPVAMGHGWHDHCDGELRLLSEGAEITIVGDTTSDTVRQIQAQHWLRR